MVGSIRAALAVAALLMCVSEKRFVCTGAKTIHLKSAMSSGPILFATGKPGQAAEKDAAHETN